ncbi:MAG: insulinase family protein, partial [Calditrichaeota bacterium]
MRKQTTSLGYKKTVLKNGLRVVTEHIPSVRSITLGVWIDVGSRNESLEENGISHLIEHMMFKGTKRRNSKEIAASLESIGGSLNAFTSREQTCYLARILDEHLDEAVDVLSDITCNATITPNNLLKEKKVVCEEIQESQETPSDMIHDIFSTTYWGKHPLGRPILGEMDNIKAMPRKKIVNYIKQNYRAESIVIAASGSVSHSKLVKLVKEKFNFESGGSSEYEPAVRSHDYEVNVVTNKNNQIHLCVGFPGVNYSDEDKMKALVLHVAMGGGMSSKLFQKIREDKGLAYTVYTYLDVYRDAGLFGAYMATDKTNLKQAVEITL